MNKEDMIEQIVESEVDDIEMDDLIRYYQDVRRQALATLDEDTLQNILDEYNLA